MVKLLQMILNYLKVAWRNLIRNKGFSTINIGGLAIGMTASLLIFLWVREQLGFDQFHEKLDRIYQVWSNDKINGTIRSLPSTPEVMRKALKEEYPDIEAVSRVDWTKNLLSTTEQKKLMSIGNVVDPDFLTIFSYPLVQGDVTSALDRPNDIVITQTLAKKLFNTDQAMGKTIVMGKGDLFTVTGVLKDLPRQTMFADIEYFCPFGRRDLTHGDWTNISVATFVLLKPNVLQATVDAKIREIIIRHSGGNAKTEEFLYPFRRVHLYGVFENGKEVAGQISLVWTLSIVAMCILLIACINFMNLSTARSEQRAREVGVRKVAGASKRTLLAQFLGESILLTAIAGILSIVLTVVCLPAINNFLLTQLEWPYHSPQYWLIFFGFILFTGVLAGSYPAFVLSSFKPISVLKGRTNSLLAAVSPRKVLVVFQFTVAIVMIISTIVISRQIRFARQRQAGYDQDRLVNIMIYDDGLRNNFDHIKHELLSSGTASSVTEALSPLTENWSSGISLNWEGKDPSSKVQINRYAEEGDLVKTAGMQLVKGRDIDLVSYPSDSTACLINESAWKLMAFNEPIGQLITDDGIRWHVVGVIRDYIQESPYQPIKPMLIKGPKNWMGVILVKLNGARPMAKNIADMQKIFKANNPAYPFEYSFADEDFAEKFMLEQFLGKLSTVFTGLVILISCLGLFGLASHTAQTRVKEIGIRKVLGASVSNIVLLLSQGFLKLVLIAVLLATPIAWWLMTNWLNGYGYRISIGATVFILSASLAAAIAMLTISFQSIRAALANPANSLRGG